MEDYLDQHFEEEVEDHDQVFTLDEETKEAPTLDSDPAQSS